MGPMRSGSNLTVSRQYPKTRSLRGGRTAPLSRESTLCIPWRLRGDDWFPWKGTGFLYEIALPSCRSCLSKLTAKNRRHGPVRSHRTPPILDSFLHRRPVKKGRKRKIRGEWAAHPPRNRLILSPTLPLFVTFARKSNVLPKLGAIEIRFPAFPLQIHPENSGFLRFFSKTTCRSMYASSSDPADPVRRTIRTQNFLNCSSPKSVHRCKSLASLPHRDDARRTPCLCCRASFADSRLEVAMWQK